MARKRQPPEPGPVLKSVIGPIELNVLGLDVRVDCQGDPIPVLAEGIPGALLGDVLSALSTPEDQAAMVQQIHIRSEVSVTPSQRA
jgi:hypothetical protein